MNRRPTDADSSRCDHDVELERSVLGQILAHRVFEAYEAAGLRTDDLYRPAHRFVFEAIQTVAGRGEEVDELTVRQELIRQGQWNQVDPSYFGGLTLGVPKPTGDHVRGLTHDLQTLALCRRFKGGLASLQRELQENPRAVEEVARVERLTALAADLSGRPDRQLALGAVEQLDALASDLARDDAGRVWFGLPSLDEALDGVRPGEVCGVIARPGIGKTLLVANVACRAAESDIGHVFFSLEMPAAQIVARLAQILSGVGRHQLATEVANDSFDRAEYQRVFRKLVLVETPGLSVAGMSVALRRALAGALRGDRVGLATIDHLGLVGGDRAMSTYDRVSTQARELKDLAKRFGVAVVVAIQANRDAGGDGSRELSLGSARDSGVVEEVMDYLVALRRPDRSTTLPLVERQQYQDVVIAKVVKNRHGAPGAEVAIRLDPTSLRLTEDPTLNRQEDDLDRIARSVGRRG